MAATEIAVPSPNTLVRSQDGNLYGFNTDVNGVVQPTAAELSRKKTFLEDNSQFPRKVMIS